MRKSILSRPITRQTGERWPQSTLIGGKICTELRPQLFTEAPWPGNRYGLEFRNLTTLVQLSTTSALTQPDRKPVKEMFWKEELARHDKQVKAFHRSRSLLKQRNPALTSFIVVGIEAVHHLPLRQCNNSRQEVRSNFLLQRSGREWTCHYTRRRKKFIRRPGGGFSWATSMDNQTISQDENGSPIHRIDEVKHLIAVAAHLKCFSALASATAPIEIAARKDAPTALNHHAQGYQQRTSILNSHQ